jgi:hypothetical protein
VGGHRLGSGAGALSGHQPHCPAAGTEEDRGGSTVAARMPGNTAPPAQGLRALESSTSVSVRSGAGARAGAKSLAGTVEVPRSSSLGPLGRVGSCAGRVTAAVWGAGGRAGGLGSGLPADARAASTSSTTVHSRSSRWSMALVSSDVGGTCG